jgi:methionine-S-sulfoxide reductase
VRVEYDPSVVSFEALLALFGQMHNPGAGWRVDPDSQYRSAIYTTTPEQLKAANEWKRGLQASGKYERVATEIKAAGPFWMAEDYHQRYYEKHGMAACRVR